MSTSGARSGLTVERYLCERQKEDFMPAVWSAFDNRDINALSALIKSPHPAYNAKFLIAQLLQKLIEAADIDFLTALLENFPEEVIRNAALLLLNSKGLPSEQNSLECIKPLLELLLIDKERFDRLRGEIWRENVNAIRMLLPMIDFSNQRLISLLEYMYSTIGSGEKVVTIVRNFFKDRLIEIIDNQLSSFNITDLVAEFSQLIFYPRQNPSSFQDKYLSPLNRSLIGNKDRYCKDDIYHLKGRPLVLEIQHQKLPIGYKVHFPAIELKAVIIDIYGGFSKKQLDDYSEATKHYVDKTLELEPRLDNKLIREGIAIVETNLCDLIELDVHQSQMPERLFRKIHRSINCLYEILQDHPESLHPELHKLKNLPFFLRGSSFGGLMSIRYAQLANQYPKHLRRFKGYLSFNGSLSGETLFNSDLPYHDEASERRDYRSHYLDPYNHIEFIKDPILVAVCLDDNNVNAKVSLDFVQKAHEHEKGNLVRLHVSQHGNKMLNLNVPNVVNRFSTKGHMVVDRNEVEAYSDAVLDFINKPISRIPEISAWREFYNNHHTNEFYRLATPEDRFVAHILKSRNRQSTSKLLSEILNDDIWNYHYKPIYLAYYYASQRNESHDLDDSDLTDEVIIKAYHEKAGPFLDYIFEANEIKGIKNQDIDIEEFIRLPAVIKAFREAIKQINNGFNFVSARFLLEQLYIHNPHLLPRSTASSTSASSTFLNSDIARDKLENALRENRTHILSLWKKTIQLSKTTSSKTTSRKHILDSRLSYDRESKRKRSLR